jgi:preprotein translocase subunit SecA
MYTKGSLIKNYRGIVDKIKKISLSTLSDDDLVRAYALVKEATKRALELKVFDVQLLGAIALNNKKIIEMSTG